MRVEGSAEELPIGDTPRRCLRKLSLLDAERPFEKQDAD
jgi:hypothetical protein